tara:strand:+ start:2269 stop:2448 length:180 start_codon:yes stop_codon:yes gene_type:complete
MPSNRELELERQALLLEMAGKIDFIYKLLSAATIQNEADEPAKEVKSERKTRKKTKKTE